MRWTLAQIAEAFGVETAAGVAADATLTGVSIDSRTIQPGELFIAIHGPRHDGHEFISKAFDRGSPVAVADRRRLTGLPDDIRRKILGVDDTLAALQKLASHACETWRKGNGRGRRRLIGAVAGSVGKTTTKEILATLVGSRYRVLKTQGNLNNEYGLPLTLLNLDDEYDAAIVELGMSHAGELAKLTQIATPDVGVITRVAVEHLEFFASIDEIAMAERELIENLPWPHATAVLNADDDRVSRFAGVARGPVIRFGTKPPAEFRAEKIEERGIAGTAFDFVSPAGRARLVSPLIGKHNVMNAIAALAAASVWGIGAPEAKEVFPALTPADKRGEVVRFEEGFTVINDSYNSSPTALGALIELLGATPGYQRRILAAGEMLELGASSEELHRDCGRLLATERSIDWIFGVQGHAADFVNAAIAAGHPKERAHFFHSSQEAASAIEKFIRPGDLVLLKGSRGVKMEKILEAIDALHRRANASAPVEALETGSKGRR